MLFSKKNLSISSSIILGIFTLMLFGTPALLVKNYTTAYLSIYDFMQIEDLPIKAILGTLVGLVGALLALNLLFIFAKKIDEKVVSIFNISAWSLTAVMAITSLFAKYIKVSYNPLNALTFILIISLIGVAASIYFLVYNPRKD